MKITIEPETDAEKELWTGAEKSKLYEGVGQFLIIGYDLGGLHRFSFRHGDPGILFERVCGIRELLKAEAGYTTVVRTEAPKPDGKPSDGT